MKIVVGAVRFPPAPGGVEAHVGLVSRYLALRGHEVIVHTTDLHTEFPFQRRGGPLPSPEGVHVYRHPCFTLPGALHYVLSPSLLEGLFKDSSDADLLYLHSYGYITTAGGAWISRVRQVPSVVTPHFHPPWSMEGPPKRALLRWAFDRTVGRFLFEGATRVLAVSRGEREELLRYFPRVASKVRIVPNAISREWIEGDFSPNERRSFREKWGVPPEAPLLLFAGRFGSNKGIPDLLSALTHLPDAYLLLVGDPQGRDKTVRELSKVLGIDRRVVITGHLSHGEYKQAHSFSDVFVLPSEYEAFGIVLLEAMGRQKPVVATSVGGIPDVVLPGRTGLLVPPKDPKALAEAIREILDDPVQARSMGEEGLRRVQEEFTWDVVLPRLEKELVEASRLTPGV